MKLTLKSILLVSLISCSLAKADGSITFAVNAYAPEAQESYFFLVQDFEKKHPDIKIKMITNNTVVHKQRVRELIEQNKPFADVMVIYGGEQLRSLAERGRLKKLDEFWSQNQLSDTFSRNTLVDIKYANQIYALPLSYYQWGIYYKKSIFEKLNLTPPSNFNELLIVIKELRKNSYTPFTVSPVSSWTYLAWFDYLNLRINGLNFHRSLLQGKIDFTDSRVAKTLATWQMLLKADTFCCVTGSKNWTESLPLLYRNIAAMALMGNFIMTAIPEDLKDDFGFFAFPEVDENIARFENVPIDGIAVSANLKMDKNLQTFLRYLTQTETLQKFNEGMRRISPTVQSYQPQDNFTQIGIKHISGAAGFFPYFDRGTSYEFAMLAQDVLLSFIQNPDSIEEVQKRLEAHRHLIKN